MSQIFNGKKSHNDSLIWNDFSIIATWTGFKLNYTFFYNTLFF